MNPIEVRRESSLDNELARARWRTLSSGAAFYHSLPWMQYVAGDTTCEPTFLTVGTDARTASTAAFLWDGRARSLVTQNQELLSKLAELLQCDSTMLLPVLFVGSMGGYLNERPILGAADDRGPAVQVIAACRALAADRGARTIAFPYLTSTGVLGLSELVERGWLLLAAEPAAHIEVPWASLEDYAAALDHDRRRTLRRDQRRFSDCSGTISEASLAECWPRLVDGLAQVQARHGHEDDRHVLAAQLQRAGELLDRVSYVLLARTNRCETEAFVWGFVAGATAYSFKLGLDYASGPRCATYFNLSYYAVIDYAIRHALRRVELGPAALEPKLVRGAELTLRWTAILDLPHDSARRAARVWNELHALRVDQLLRKYRGELSEADRAASSLAARLAAG